MKTKILPVIIVLFLIVTSINVMAVTPVNDDNNIEIFEEEDHISFSQATIETKGDYVSINLEETDTFLRVAGKPMLPVYTKTFVFSPGTKIKNVECIISDVKSEEIDGKIQPAPQPVPLISVEQSNKNDLEEAAEDVNVYSSSDLYPGQWSDYTINCGLDKGKRAIFVTIRCYPIRYSPAENSIYYIENLDIEVTFEEGENPFPSESKYDLVIITPRKFLFRVLPLKFHKEKMGVSTKIKTTESIYRQYLFKGRDKPERVKLFIKDAIENWGITYVLLMGARDYQRFKYNVPVRFSNLDDWSGWNEHYVSDLYYADIYKGEGEFEDWDSNGNGVFAEWNSYDGTAKKDILDLYPDVYIGRLACKNKGEVTTVVKKIIKYETTANGQEWFKKMIVVGGDTVPTSADDYEGEIENELAASYLEPLGFEITRLWTSLGTLTSYEDVTNTVSEGAGFLYFSGHGNPMMWSTHPPNNDSWIDALSNIDMKFLENDDMLPICIVGGCHNSQFDVGLPHMILGILKQGFLQYFFNYSADRDCFNKLTWVFNCWSWNLVKKVNGGTLATIGNTGLGWGCGGPGCVDVLDGWINTHFFQLYRDLHEQENCTLGMIHSETIRDYVDEFDPNGDYNRLDRKTVEQWVLLGDPSLIIGGYPSS